MHLRLAFALLLAALAATPARAGQASARFGITLVIAPRCTDAADPAREIAALAATPEQAVDLAAQELGVAPQDLVARHDRLATGWWLISLASAAAPVLRVEKCSGAVERL